MTIWVLELMHCRFDGVCVVVLTIRAAVKGYREVPAVNERHRRRVTHAVTSAVYDARLQHQSRRALGVTLFAMAVITLWGWLVVIGAVGPTTRQLRSRRREESRKMARALGRARS
jgi:hypothetical protein